MPINVVDREQVKKIASIIKSRCKKAGHVITLSACRDIAARLYGYLNWNHLLKRSVDREGNHFSWEEVQGSFLNSLRREPLPPIVIDEIMEVLKEHFAAQGKGSTEDVRGQPNEMRADLDRMYAEEDFDGLLEAILDISPSVLGKFDSGFFDMVDEIVRRNPEAALALSNIIPESGSPDVDMKARLARLQLGIGRSDAADPHLHLAMALLLITSNRSEALTHLDAALEAGCPDAPYVAGMFAETEAPPNLTEAMEHYQAGFEDHDDLMCGLAIARLLLSENALDPADYDYDAEELLEELGEFDTAEGDQARSMLNMLHEARTTPRVLSEKVIPISSKRPKLVRDAIKSYFDISIEKAEAATASLHGFESWGRLLNAAKDPRTIKGPFDEDLDAPRFVARRNAQVGVLRMHVPIDQYFGEIAIPMLGATSRQGRPSLRKLKETASNRLIPFDSRSMEESMKEFVKSAGIDFDGSSTEFFNMLRSAKPIDPEVWCEYLRDTCKWDIREIKPSPTIGGSKVAQVKGEGRSFDVYMIGAAYEPGDRTDLLVDKMMKDIDQNGGDAILLFSKVAVFRGKKSNLGVLYGGRMRLDSNWTDFTVRPNCGIKGAIDQIGHFQYPPNDEFISRFGFSDYLEAGAWISANSAEGPDGPIKFGLISMASGWTSYVRA
ncbi:hypothetical protein [Rhizobium sp. BK176]|uniref:hypothetical protein n=1 Tax=Rhizobium sp. BK176 TaxID=2587071 RepID=UPI002168CFD2|nr:hypothetical protein [Rhizobium sp. BK176]MCS4089339.1 hypothetical protein [Rhizobium sp. BK176]